MADLNENIAEQDNFAAKKKINQFFFDFEFIPTDTIDALREKAGVGEDYIDGLDIDLTDKAVVMAKLDYYRTMQHFSDIIAKNLEEGESIAEFIERIGEDSLTQTLGIAKENPWYSNVVYRTVSAQAYSAGKWESSQSNEQIVMLEYLAVADERTTEICNMRNGTTLPKDDPWWRSNYPPLHFQCRSDVVEYTQAYVDAFGIEQLEPLDGIDEPGEGFGSVDSFENGGWLVPTKQMKADLSVWE